MIQNKTQKFTVCALLLAIGIILPYATAHGFGIPGTMLLPMHIPVFLCGFLCGPLYGGALGLMLPILNSLLTGMPTLFPMLPIMLCELTVYGFTSGAVFTKTALFRQKYGIYIALPISMICGRIAYAIAFYTLLLFIGDLKALSIGAAIVTGIPGIIIQLVLIPQIVLLCKRGVPVRDKTSDENRQ